MQTWRLARFEIVRKEMRVELYWVLVKGFNLSYHTKETILFTIGPHCGNSNQTLIKFLNKNPVRDQGSVYGFRI